MRLEDGTALKACLRCTNMTTETKIVDLAFSPEAAARLVKRCPTVAEVMEEMGFVVERSEPIEWQARCAAATIIGKPGPEQSWLIERKPLHVCGLILAAGNYAGLSDDDSLALLCNAFPSLARRLANTKQAPDFNKAISHTAYGGIPG